MSNNTTTSPTSPTNVGKWIREQLVANAAVSAIVGTKIFPYTTADPQNLPWIVWDNLVVYFDRTKDRTDVDSVSFSVLCAAATPESSSQLATAAMNCLNGRQGCNIESWASSYNDDIGFIIELSFKIEI